MKEQSPNYYGIIHADVRYDKDISPHAKVLYAELTALTNSKGYCWANNAYFANLYDKTERAIQKWLSQLAKKEYINIKIGDKNNTRKIYIYERKFIGVRTQVQGGMNNGSQGNEQRDTHNTITNNKDNNNSIVDLQKQVRELTAKLELSTQKPKTKRKIFIAPTLEAVTNYFKEKQSSTAEAQKFYYHYESNGWKVGKNKMQKWRSSASGWISRNKPTVTQPQQKDLAASYKQHLTYYLNEKQRRSLNGQIEGYLSKCKESGVQSEIDTFKGQMQGVKNKTFTDALIFDVIYGTLQKCGTIPERRFSKFRQWFNKLKDYDKNQKDLRIEFRKHLSK